MPDRIKCKYSDMYEIATDGSIKSLYTNRLMKTQADKDGYLRVGLYYNKKLNNFYLHRLIAEHFIANEENKAQVNHIDGNKQNNSLSNLEWVTHAENMQHAIRTGLKSGRKGTKHHNVKLNEDNILEIRRLLNSGMSQYSIAKIFKVRQSTIAKIKLGQRWGHI